ncbi:INO80 complex subunit C-like [Acropora muricata]|uniref:INO80 complex subunit C-like n=1 Tax=Acropora millepora TaxID=45264 RepID=UPI0010FC714B|nr:INO80 complex subunit C-like [Acropora millepora]
MATSRSKKAKRSQSPASASCPVPSKRKRSATPCVADEVESNSSGRSSLSSFSVVSEANVNPKGQFVFKDVNFEHSGVNAGKKKIWKNLKQIMGLERGLPWKQDDPTYSSIDAPPSFKPAKKYADLSGLPAKYKDPSTGIQYNNSMEFGSIRSLPMDIVSGYLALRKAAPT